MRAFEQREKRAALLALDIAVCAVLLVSAASFLVARGRVHAADADAQAIADWAWNLGITRIAWPDDKREAVTALLDAGMTPVLVPATSPPAQQLAVNNTPVLVSTDAGYLSDLSQSSFQSGPFTARVIDLGKAARVPIANGESLGEQISRPYLYAPLRDSRRVLPGQPWSAPVTLSAGHYRLSAAVFDPQFKGSATLSATLGNRTLAGTGPTRLEAGVIEPMRVEFDVTDKAPVPVALRLVVTGNNGSVGAMHEWELERQEGSG